MVRQLTTIALMGTLLAATGCFRLRTPTLDRPLPIEATVEAEPWTPYPKSAERGDDWDIVVSQYRDSIQLTNRTARSYQNVQLWLNQQYVATVPEIRIGSDNRISLIAFVNQHGESYPMPGLLTPDKAFPALACEIFSSTDGKRHRLLARQ